MAASAASAYWSTFFPLGHPKNSTSSSHHDPLTQDAERIASWAGEDTDLRRLLEHHPGDLSELHDDTIVEYQLVQFPAYGTNQQQPSSLLMVTSNGTEPDEDEPEDEEEEGLAGAEEQHARHENNNTTHHHQPSAWSPKTPDHWLQWMGGGTNSSGVEEEEDHENDEYFEDEYNRHHEESKMMMDQSREEEENESYHGGGGDYSNKKRGHKQRKESSNSWNNNNNNRQYSKGSGVGGISQNDTDWDIEEQMLWKTKSPRDDNTEEEKRLTPTTQRHTLSSQHHPPPQSAPASSWKIISGDKQHWMPDILCKQCYACEAPFTIIRRRHHCRLCGQVFCNTCSAFFLHKHRVCQLCFEEHAEKQQEQQQLLTDPSSTTTTVTPATTHAATSTTNGATIPPAVGTPAATTAITITSNKSPSSGSEHAPAANEFTWRKERLSNTSNTTTTKPAVPSENDTAKQRTKKSNTKTSLQDPIVRDGQRHLGRTAADHLEGLARHLLSHHAPALGDIDPWVHPLLTLATKCCATVVPNVKKRGDLLDIRPYVKVKCIPGGKVATDCAYLSGVMFRKNVSHKRMAKEVEHPRILLLAGAMEFTRLEHRIASLETLFEQENAYMEIIVGKILKVKPHVVLVAKAVSRRAQELLLQAGVVLVQHVKAPLMARIARQTGATVLTNHHVNQFGPSVLGSCKRFRLVTFRDNEIWQQHPTSSDNDNTTTVKSIQALLADPTLSNHERQAALAANRLGEDVLDGVEAVKRGLAKRGVAHTYILLEGCPPELGCTVVLRGATKAALKQVKAVLQFLAGAAYSLHLETTFLRERGVRLDPQFTVGPRHAYSTSLAVDYGNPPEGRTLVRPWNGGVEPTPASLKSMTAMDHQAILITSVWMTDETQCCPAEVKGICYYSLQDVALGQFLRDSCFNLSLKCQNPNCKKSVLDHSLSFVHNDGLINIMVEEMDEPLQEDSTGKVEESDTMSEEELIDKPIATWTHCLNCKRDVSLLTYISDNTWKFSFGKFLEVFFYNRHAIINSNVCSCNAQQSSVLYFGCGKLAARFTYERVKPFGVFVRKVLPLDYSFHRQEARMHVEMISAASRTLFMNFHDHVDRISREARVLFNSAMNRPEHLQTVFSELGKIGSEVSHASEILREKIETMSESFNLDDELYTGTLFRIPLFIRRHVFNLTTAWNEKLNAAGQAISAMKKISAASANMADGGLGSNSAVDDALNDELTEGMKRLHQLIEHYQRYNVMDINQVIPSLHGQTIAASHDGEYDEYFDNPDSSIDFADGVDADVLASRRRLKSSKHTQIEKPTKSLGTRRSTSDTSKHDSSMRPPKSTPGGAVKSALKRFFIRHLTSDDKYSVDLGIFNDGRPRLPPGVDDIVVPVIDEQLSSIIAYSLASAEYAKQFKAYAKSTSGNDSGQDPLTRRPDAPSRFDSGTSRANDGFEQSRGKQGALSSPLPPESESRGTERRMLNRNKSHIKHTFRDFDGKGQVSCKFVCTTYWATQFHSVRQGFLTDLQKNTPGSAMRTEDTEQGYIESLSSAYSWSATGGKSGASFARTSDERFVIKCISRTELQMFLDCAPAYFEYLSKAFFHGLPTVLCKIVGVYQIGIHNLETGKKNMEQVAVMQNMFYKKKISMIFDLKGSLRGRFAAHIRRKNADGPADNPSVGTDRQTEPDIGGDKSDEHGRNDDAYTLDSDGTKTKQAAPSSGPSTLLDGDFLEFTFGRPMPLTDRAKAVFQMSILNDTLFLSIINVLDYSIVVGLDEENMELVVGIIDFMRQYDILKQMERVGKSLPMVVGSEAPTIIQPPLYKARFTNAMERYFMTVPSKWTTI